MLEIIIGGWTMRINKETGETHILNTNFDEKEHRLKAWWIKVDETPPPEREK